MKILKKEVKNISIKSLEFRQAEKDLELINKAEKDYMDFSNMQVQAMTWKFKERLAKGETLEDIKVEAFAVAREAIHRVLRKKLFDVQILGALMLHNGSISEMRTGEGKTITSIPAVYLNALSGKSVIVSTVNEYLTERDAAETGRVYKFLGLTTGVNLKSKKDAEKRQAYACDVTYSVHSEIGFDYLRDNMVDDISKKVQRPFYFCLIDEVDSILIDEAKTPLIISGGEVATTKQYEIANGFVNTLDEHDYDIDWETKGIQLTPRGMDHANNFFGVKNIFEMEHSEMVHRIQNSLRANFLMFKDEDYIVKDGKIELVDSFTGRVLEGRSYSDGLQQAIQAKEGVEIEPENRTLATITYQNLFRMFKKLCGMTGTAKTEEKEFIDIYNVRVNVIPTNKPMVRIDHPDSVFVDLESKYTALLTDVQKRHEKGQPILLGTEEVAESEIISSLLTELGIKHTVLNAKQNEQEAEIVAKAGEFKAITIATNMAGRGTDIKPTKESLAVGGLYVIGTNRAESRRIDNQLRGRAGRQGDVGESKFYLSLEDNLIKRFARQQKLQKKWSSYEMNAIDKKSMPRILNKAQEKIEGANYDARKSVLQYDDVVRQQRDLVYSQRDIIISNKDLKEVIKRMMSSVVKNMLNSSQFLKPNRMFDYEVFADSVNKLWFSLVGTKINAEEIKKMNNDTIEKHVIDTLHNAFDLVRERTFENMGQDLALSTERNVILNTLDQYWQMHIDQMSKLKSSASMVQYAQKNPYQEYVEKGNELFQEMLQLIPYHSVRLIMENKYIMVGRKVVIREIEKAISDVIKDLKASDIKEIAPKHVEKNTPTTISADSPANHIIEEPMPQSHIDNEKSLDVTKKNIDKDILPEQLIEFTISADEQLSDEKLEEIKEAVKKAITNKSQK